MRTIAIASQKGGCGKTTASVNLAATIADAGKRVLLIDLDPQASSSKWLGQTDSQLLQSFTNNTSLASITRNTGISRLDLVPAALELVKAERLLARRDDGELVFRSLLAGLPKRWDFVIVDCPPSFGFFLTSALAAVTEVIIPVDISALGVDGLAGIVQLIHGIREELNPELRIAAVVPCRTESRTNLARDVLSQLRQEFGTAVAPPIRENVRLREASAYRLPINLYAPRSAGDQDYRALARYVMRRKPA